MLITFNSRCYNKNCSEPYVENIINLNNLKTASYLYFIKISFTFENKSNTNHTLWRYTCNHSCTYAWFPSNISSLSLTFVFLSSELSALHYSLIIKPKSDWHMILNKINLSLCGRKHFMCVNDSRLVIYTKHTSYWYNNGPMFFKFMVCFEVMLYTLHLSEINSYGFKNTRYYLSNFV